MKDLTPEFWKEIKEKYPREAGDFLIWKLDKEEDHSPYSLSDFPPAFQLGLFLQYTAEKKTTWYPVVNRGSVSEQISWWFELEHRKNVKTGLSVRNGHVVHDGVLRTKYPTQL